MKNETTQRVAAIVLIAAITIYRLCIGLHAHHAPWLENFSPVAAIALCGGAFLPRRVAFIIPLAALFISDIFLNAHYGYALVSPEMISRYLALAAIVAIGFALRQRAHLLTLLPASVLGSAIFYIVTNTSSWLTWPAYAKTPAGWLQALTVGLPGYAPTWTFFRSSLISDLLFTALFLLCMAVARTSEPTPSLAHAR